MKNEKQKFLLVVGYAFIGILIGVLLILLFENRQKGPTSNNSSYHDSLTNKNDKKTNNKLEEDKKKEPEFNSNNNGSANPKSATSKSHEVVENKKDEDYAKLAFEAIDEISHPEDPQNPENINSLTDDDLEQISTEDIASLIETTLTYAEKNKKEPRYLFALGRAVLIHGDEEFAEELLSKAANNGSAAAYTYLAHMTDDLDKKVNYLEQSAQGGFEPAQRLLADIYENLEKEQKTQQSTVDFNQFSFPELMKAFYSGTSSQYAQKPLLPLTYISSINDTLNDQSMLYMVENPKKFMRELQPSLSIEVGRKISTSPVIINQATKQGFNMLKGFFGAIAETRRRGGSIAEEIAASNKALLNGGNSSGSSSYMTLQEAKQLGTKDGRLMAFLFDQSPEGFRRIYQGMQRFVRQEVR